VVRYHSLRGTPDTSVSRPAPKPSKYVHPRHRSKGLIEPARFLFLPRFSFLRFIVPIAANAAEKRQVMPDPPFNSRLASMGGGSGS